MLAKEKRFNLKTGFAWITSGKRMDHGFLRVFFRFGENSAPKIAVATPKSIFKKAVDRNKAKRVISKIVEEFYLDICTGANILIMPKKDFDSNGLDESLKEVFKKAGLFKE